MVQNVGNESKRPSVLPYALGGTAVGAAAGWGASKLGFTQAARYNSWQDVLKDSKDLYVAAEKEGASDAVKNAKTAIEGAKKTYTETLQELFKNKDSFKKVADEVTKNKEALDGQRDNFKKVYKELVDDIIKNDGAFDFKHDGKTGDELTKKAHEYVKELLGKKDVNADWTKVKELQAAHKSYTEAGFKSGKLKDVKLNQLTDDAANKVKEASTKAWDAVKEKVTVDAKEFKAPRTKTLMIAGAIAGLLAGALLLKPKAKPAE